MQSILFKLVFIFCFVSSPVVLAKTILVYGDSLSAAYGISEEEGWVALLQKEIGDEHTLVNASISGETSSGGLSRLTLTLDELKPDLVLLELGANDGLRGGSVSLLQANLDLMLNAIKSRNIKVVLIGISVPPSYGPRYVDAFRAVYRNLAEQHKVPFIDFYREDFFIKEGYIQADGLHPTAIAQPIVTELMLDFLIKENLLEQ